MICPYETSHREMRPLGYLRERRTYICEYDAGPMNGPKTCGCTVVETTVREPAP